MGNRPSCSAPPRCTPRAYVTPPCRRGCSSQSDVWHGSQRNMCRNRSRHCFVYRAPPVAKHRPGTSCRPLRSSNTSSSCCCRRRRTTLRGSCRQRRSSSTVDCCCPPPDPVPLAHLACCCPVKESTLEKPLCCVPRHRLCEPERARCPHEHFAPAAQAINENIEEPCDTYYNYDRNQQNDSLPGADAMANFDLNRFERDNTECNGGYGRRRNVSIRTCVDYDYDPGNQSAAQPYQRLNMAPSGPYLYRHSCPNSRQLRPYSQFLPAQRNRHPPLEYDRSFENLSNNIPCRNRR